ncbi:juvenile hormone esterase-like [Ostrinia furnacalis]|uniref:juvenile hormone esterase-like n=1 Tax=Ostrinia furnacalis TaxID=93504 RepID=UPI00103954EC|nr:juvenile hormone esterase-like [Ostrinia furnacalis]
MLAFKVLGVLLLSCAACLCDPDLSGCEVAAKTEQGYVCGRIRKANNGVDYASFRGIRHAKPPLGELRFKELQPPEPFDGVFNATETGPICPQTDVFYKSLMQPRDMSEDCIRINIHVPYKNLPNISDSSNNTELLPIMFWIHGGGFAMGSGDPDLHGPEYLVTKDVILVTINYRLHVFGFLSLDNEYFPGNNGLRDAIAALKWVQKNIRNFGGNPDMVSVGGQSAGAVMAHLLTLAPASSGLFKQCMAFSGQGIVSFFSYSAGYRDVVNALFFTEMRIPYLILSPKQIHDQLVKAPIEKILAANKVILDIFGVTSFAPTIEKPQENFTTMISEDPEILYEEGIGKEYPVLLGFANNESHSFTNRFLELNMPTTLTLAPVLIVPLNLVFSANPLILPILLAKQRSEYVKFIRVTLDDFMRALIDMDYLYLAQRLSLQRLAVGAAKTYMYQFTYTGKHSPIKESFGLNFTGAGHVEDITYFFRVNSFLGPITDEDEMSGTTDGEMKELMTTSIANFVSTGSPVKNDSDWPATDTDLSFQLIGKPALNYSKITPYMAEKKAHYDDLYSTAGRSIP